MNRKKQIETRMFASRDEIARGSGVYWPVSLAEKKNETVTAAEIAEFLNRSALGHDAFYRYTTMSRLDDYLNTGKLYLSRLSEMNDLTEWKRTHDASRIYLVCFSFGELENMSMWRLYGGGQDESVRLEFRKKDIIECLGGRESHKVYEVDPNGRAGKEIASEDIAEWSFHDVAYVYGKALLWNRRIIGESRCRALENPYVAEELITRIKDYGWMMENEVRLVIKLKESSPGLKRIAVDFRPAIDHVKILLGPVVSKHSRVKKIFENHGVQIDNGRIRTSDNEVVF